MILRLYLTGPYSVSTGVSSTLCQPTQLDIHGVICVLQYMYMHVACMCRAHVARLTEHIGKHCYVIRLHCPPMCTTCVQGNVTATVYIVLPTQVP